MTLDERARRFILSGSPDEEFELLSDCIEAGSVEALHAVQVLYEDMYGGLTYNYDFKAPAAWCLARWGEQGLTALVEGATRTRTTKNVSITLDVLATFASNALVPQRLPLRDDLVSKVNGLVSDWDELRRVAGRMLREYALSFEDDEDLLIPIGVELQRAALQGPQTVEVLFQALAGRWLAVRPATLSAFDDLIRNHADDEPSFQSFFENHPLLLDPMAFAVFPRPDIHGAKEPDFLIQRTDGTFLVIEIETPGKLLLTQANQLSAEATHAVAQATDYADFLAERLDTIRRHLLPSANLSPSSWLGRSRCWAQSSLELYALKTRADII